MSVATQSQQHAVNAAYGNCAEAAWTEIMKQSFTNVGTFKQNLFEQSASVALELVSEKPWIVSRGNGYVRTCIRNAIRDARVAESGGAMARISRNGKRAIRLTPLVDPSSPEAQSTFARLAREEFKRLIDEMLHRVDGTHSAAYYLRVLNDKWFEWASETYGKDAAEIFRQRQGHDRQWPDLADEYGLTVWEVRKACEQLGRRYAQDFAVVLDWTKGIPA